MFQNQLSNLSNFEGIQLEVDVSIITLDDNLNHTYCSKIKWEQDNRAPVGTAKLTMPYNEKIEKYWTKYSGTVIIHANLNSKPNTLTRAMMNNFSNSVSLNLKNVQEDIEKNIDIKKDKKNKLHIKNDKYNYTFIGKVYRFKQVGKTFVVYLEDLGWKFMQKVPKDFRDTYIAGQSLDDAFQAICEFMGVNFAYSIADLNEYSFSADGYSIEKDGQVIENVPSILKEWSANTDDNEEDGDEENIDSEDARIANSLKNGQHIEASGIAEYNDKKNQIKKQLNNQSLNSKITNTTDDDNQEDTSIEEEDNTTINDKILKYQEDFDEKIKDLFIGNTLYDSNISDPILNYNWITITPKVPSASGTTGGGSSGSSSSDSSSNESSSNNNISSSFGNTSSRAREKNGWINGQYYINGKIYLSKEYINSLSPKQAGQKRNSTNASRTYTSDTMQKLLWRSMGQTLR